MFRLNSTWFAASGAHISGSGAGELVIVLTTMMSLVVLAGVTIYVLCLQNYFDYFTDITLIRRNINICFLFMTYQFYFATV